MVTNNLRAQWEPDFRSGYGYIQIPYPQTVPAGLAYDVRDPVWGNLQDLALHRTIQNGEIKVVDSWNKTLMDFVTIGGRPSPDWSVQKHEVTSD